MKAAIVGGLIALTAMSAQAEEWIAVASASGAAWHVKAGSAKVFEHGFTVVERQRINGRTSYVIATVTTKDCLKGYGTMMNFDLRNTPLAAHDFVLGGTTVADVLASAYCGVVLQMQSRDL
jgi:hypothetical protein